MSWWEYVREITGGDNPVEISQRIERYIDEHPDEPLERVSHQAIRRWRMISTARPTSPMVRSLVRAYGADMREAMIAAGILTKDDLSHATDEGRDPLDRAMAKHWARLDYPQRSAVVDLLKELSRRNKT